MGSPLLYVTPSSALPALRDLLLLRSYPDLPAHLLLTVRENRFEFEGKTTHEIVFVYEANLADPSLYDREAFVVTEKTGTLPGYWRRLTDFDMASSPLYPEGLLESLSGPRRARAGGTEPTDNLAEWRAWTGKIRASAICAIRRQTQVLAARGYDPARDLHFWFLPGGGMRFGETSEEAVRREVREELGAEVVDLRRLEVLENRFTHDGDPFHAVMFVYEGNFADPSMYERDSFPGEAHGEWETAGWRDLAGFDEEPLFPEGLLELLRGR